MTDKKGRLAISALLCLVVLFFSGAGMAEEPDQDEILAEQFWQMRDDQAELVKAIAAYEKILQKKPEDFVLLSRLSQALYWKGENAEDTRANKKEKLAAYEKGMEYAGKVLSSSPDNAPANFWYASNLAKYGATVGIVKSLSALKEIRASVEKTMKIEPFYFKGGPQRFLAKLILSVPKPFRKSLAGGTLKDGEKMLVDAISHEPDFALSYVFLAEIHLKMKKKKQAEKDLRRVLTIADDALPGYMAEIRRDKKRALALLEKHFGGV